ncbi:anthranilate synthase component I [Natronogracilivirga saccharolytica]|uniref:Anthranilate synthase component 1 n=1 Tax=Natronogracilivirga saccharolytica TaxID=2812953 RepID=A0A8J7S5M7_9BACT|nr:anthranilate synthase component I [Natronogracilivirga saccharolytica]MBP3192418.1 anthranilate synthase component I [Natronogracilivirga saccharolytica]
MNPEEFKQLAQTYTAIPVSRVLMADTVTPVSLFLKIRSDARYPFLLESVEGGEQMARYSFIGKNPYQALKYKDGKVSLARYRKASDAHAFFDGGGQSSEQTDGGFEEKTLDEGYFPVLRKLCTAYLEPELPDLPRLTGGAVGFSAYDTVRLVEDLPDSPEDDLGLPEAIWAFYDEIFAFDHVKHRVLLIKTVFTGPDEDHDARYSSALKSLDMMEDVFNRHVTDSDGYRRPQDDLESNISREQFREHVKKAREHIHAGDIFQVVLSQRFRSRFEGDRFMLYRALRMVNPSPYLFYLDFDDFALIGSSPEVLVQVRNKDVRLLPIAGTRPRGKDPEEDRAFEEDLKADPKELAEHIMLVDLGRNDLSRVCDPDTVTMVRDRVIERYSHVMHIVSDVCGRLSEGKTAVDALENCFPAGTVSGAPKVRAMEIIDGMEPTKRGPYAGAVGYFDFSGNMDTCIAIRTMVVTDRDIYIQAGAGIVADSDPDREYDETVNKARALVEALSVALKLE